MPEDNNHQPHGQLGSFPENTITARDDEARLACRCMLNPMYCIAT